MCMDANAEYASNLGKELGVPHTSDLKELSRDVILSRNGLLEDLFDRNYLEKLLYEKNRMEAGRWSTQVWTLLMLALWEEHCFVKAS